MIEGYRLSSQQKQIWTAQQEGGSFAAQAVVEIEGRIDVSRLKGALREVVARHDALRTRFEQPAGFIHPLQVIDPAPDFAWSEVSLDSSDAPDAVFRACGAERAAPGGPPLHATLVALASERHALVLTTTALCADAASLANVTIEVGRIYTGNASEITAADALTQYSAYSEWQNSLEDSDYGKGAREFWNGRDLERIPSLALGLEKPYEEADVASAPVAIRVPLQGDIMHAVEAACERYRATPELFLLACWQTLIARVAGVGDCSVGTLIHGRAFDELQSAIGLFARFVPIGCRLEGRPRFADVLQQIEEQRFQCEAWTDYFVWPAAQEKQSTGFPFTFAFEVLPAELGSGDVRFTPKDIRARVDRSRLHLRVVAGAGRLEAEIEYASGVYDADTVTHLAAFYASLLKQFTRDPESCIGDVPFVEGEDRERLIRSATGPRVAVDSRTVHELFSEAASRFPDRPAVACGNAVISYAALEGRAQQLARALRALGVGPDVVVALFVSRSAAGVVGLLGILEAGGAYMPMDSDLPAARVAQQLAGSRAAVAVTELAYRDRLSDFAGPVVCLDDPSWLSASAGSDVLDLVCADNLAYVIHTSGSSGVPKAVGISHRNLVNYVNAASRLLGYTSVGDMPALHFATVSTFSADLGHTCIFPSLLSGGCLHVVGYELATDPVGLAAYIQSRRIDVMKMVPSHLNGVLACPGTEGVIPSTALVLGGESLTHDLACRIADALPSCRIVHHYGPTETTVGAVAATVVADRASDRPASLPIGRPLDNVAAYVCDENLNLMPPGLAGELYIAGAGVGRGYLNDARRTAERFLPDPFGGTSSRLYATGDRARYRPDHAIEFLGRRDRQVKIRGHRVELADIESALRRHSRVRESAVVLSDPQSPAERLGAYVVVASSDGVPSGAAPADATAALTQSIREHLSSELPEYMLPAAIAVLPTLPLTANGKIDYDRLPALDALEERTAGEEPVASPLADLVAEIFADNLSLDSVGLHDNYFELGGHSLLAMRLVSQIRQVFGVDLPLRAVFDTPTVARLSEAIEAAVRSAEGLDVPAITPVSRDQDLPLSFGQQRLWFLDRLDPNSSYNILWSLRMRGPLDIDVLGRSLAEVLRRHEVLRTTFELRGEQPVLVIAPPGPVDLPVIDLRGVPDREAEARRLSLEEARRPVDLRHGPLLRAQVLQLDEDDHVFVMTIHHIVSDRWSREILTRELRTIYDAYSAGQPHGLPELSVQYADYAFWQRSWLRGEVLNKQLRYWKTQLAGAPALEMPTDKPRPPIQTISANVQVITVPKSVARALRQLGRSEGATLYMAVLAAFQTLLHRYTGQEDVVVGSPIAGRTRGETERLIGFFLNTLAMRVNFAERPTFREVLRRVREAALGAYSHQDLPFEKLVEELNPQRDMSRAPLLQAMFDMDMTSATTGRVAAELGSLHMESFGLNTLTARFDLQLDVVDGDNGLTFKLAYNTDLFEASTIRRMLRHLRVLMDSALANPDLSVCRLPLLIEPERGRLVEPDPVRPAQPFVPLGREWIEQGIAGHFRAHAAACPERVAVKTRTHTWTYGELHDVAAAAAWALRDAGRTQQATVALLFDHDAPMVAGVLGALMAGKCYVPLDPTHPDERLEDVIADCEPVALLTTRAQLARAESLAPDGVEVLVLENLPPAPDPMVLPPVTPEQLAYILYTSGTEGRPKGVAQTHRNVLHFVRNYTNNLRVTHEDRLTLFSTYGADAAVMDIFAAMLNGATLYPIDPRQEALPEIKERLRAEQITIFHSTPTLFSFITESFEGVELPDVRLVVLGGEEALRSHFEKYKACFSDECLFVNGLGPTESTVTLQFFANKSTRIERNSVPVGYPVDDTEVLLLDEDLDSAGVHGEICIRSRYVALGYWRDSARTQEAFLRDPADPSMRIYRTGDLGRLLPDGAILFLGRKDAQVKINGFRVEPSNVQAALNRHPKVLDSVVLAREHAGTKLLVAYYIPRETTGCDAAQLRQFMQAAVPGYMIPSFFVAVQKFPQTPNGKLDREALLASTDFSLSVAGAIAPRDFVELRLTQIWAELLNIPSVPVNADFFQMGGSSLSVIRLLARTEQVFGLRIPLAQLFQDATVESLAALVRQGGGARSEASLVAIQPRGSLRPFFCVHPVGGTVICYWELARALGDDQPCYAFEHPSVRGGFAPATIEELAACYVDELLRHDPVGPYQLGGLSMGGVVAFEMAQQLTALGREVSRLVMFDTFCPGPRPHHDPDDADLLAGFVQSLGVSPEALRELDPAERMERVVEIARSKRLVVPGFTAAEAARLFEMASANMRASRAYSPRPYAGQVTLFACDERDPSRPPDRGWLDVVGAGLEIQTVSAHHHNLLVGPHVDALASSLRATLASTLEAATGSVPAA